VQTILAMRDHLQRLVPEARIVVAHGQMEERALERAMRTFVGKEANCLLCTSIIESGLDIPAANTILINRADTFGLSQLYQIRGRVGRSNVQAVCYLLTPPEVALPTAAQQRLATLARLTELGSGFSIAMHDLEQRGAGNLLGAEQSGHIAAIGYEMFTKLLEQTMRRCKGEAEPTAVDPEITLPVPASLPEGYLADPQQRLVWYKRLATMEDSTELDAAAAELQDRFGVLPESARHLFRIISIKQAAKALGVDLVRYDKGTFIFRFHAQTPVDPGRLMAYVDRHKETHALRPNGILAIRHPCTEPAALCDAALDYLRRMTEWNR
ncbi:MAG: transcription-repair coupling factor, partial [Deltaproteobacteria bacterium]|nr:transcription-repair coupling factor [Deltaproteobacteria bacterium]